MNRQGDQVSINVFEIIDEICREFRKEWKSGRVTDIAKYVERVNESAQPILFRNLLNTEIKLRMRRGESPESSDYLKRFPQFAHIIRQEFDESTMGSFELADGTPEDSAGRAVVEQVSAVDSEADHTRTYDELAASRLGDYELIRELGRGGFGVVYEARHVKQQNRVALKTLPTGTDGQEVNADRLHKFRKEFRTLSEINHPNLVGMQTLEFDGTQWFFTMDLVKGTDFLSYVRPKDWLDEKHLRASIKQLAAGIMALHDKGIVHRDLKPSNVLVEPNGRVVILDFGLVAQLQQHPDMTATKSAMFAGTPRYAAPEQMFGQRSEASDWYAMGVMLYEALTGAPPFPGRNPMEVLQQKQNEDPPTLSGRDDIPNDLATLADTLLRREPSQRATTSHIAQELKLDLESTKHPSAGSTDSEGVEIEAFPDEEIELIGREEQLSQLEAAKQQLLVTRNPVVCWITGLSGEGKSALAEKFLAPLRRGKEMLVLSGRCYDRESVPFKVIDSIIESLIRFLGSSFGKHYQSKLPSEIGFLAKLFPLLNRVEAIKETPLPDVARLEPENIRARAFYAFRELLTSIALQTPIVIHIDDLQWGDSDSTQVLIDLMTASDKPAIMLLGNYRSDEFDSSPFLQNWKQSASISLIQTETFEVNVAPLSKEQCLELIVSRTGADSGAISDQIEQLITSSGGNPYLFEQLMAGIDSTTSCFVPVPIEDIIADRLHRLPSAAANLLDIIAVSGQSISVEEAGKTVGLTPTELGVMTHMRSEQLVRLIGSRDDLFVETYHDKIRESVLAGMSDEKRRGLHLELAEAIETKEGLNAEELLSGLSSTLMPSEQDVSFSPRVFDLAHHFLEAGDKRAFVYQMIAAELAVSTYAIDEALDRFRCAERWISSQSDSALRFRFFLAFGRVLHWNNLIEEAIRNYQSALENAPDSLARARAHFAMGRAHNHLGHFDSTIAEYDHALTYLGKPRAKSTFGKLLSFCWNSFLIVAIPARWQRVKDTTKARLLVEMLDGMSISLLEKDFFAFLEVNAKLPVFAFRSGGANYFGYGYAYAAYTFAAIGAIPISRICFSRSTKSDLSSNDIQFHGYLQGFKGAACYWSGSLIESEKFFCESMPLLQLSGNSYDSQRILHMLRHGRAHTNSSSMELQSAKELLKCAKETQNIQATCWGLYDVASALARIGELTGALGHMHQSYLALRGERYYLTEAVRASTDGYVRLQCSDYIGSRKSTLSAWKTITDTWLANDVTLLCLPILIESITGPEWISPLTAKDEKLVKKMLRRAAFLYRTIPNHQPHILRVSGRAAMAMGKRRKAISKFEKAIRVAEKKSMDYQRAKCLLDLAAVKEEDRDKNRAEAIELLKKMESVIPRAESWLLGDQYDEAVVAPEFDLEAWEKENGPVTPYLDELEKVE